MDIGCKVDVWEIMYLYQLIGEYLVLDWIIGSVLVLVCEWFSDESWQQFWQEFILLLNDVYLLWVDGSIIFFFWWLFMVVEVGGVCCLGGQFQLWCFCLVLVDLFIRVLVGLLFQYWCGCQFGILVDGVKYIGYNCGQVVL